MRLRSWKKPPAAKPFLLDQPLIRFSRQNAISWRDSSAGGILITGSPGVGKSSAVIASIVVSALNQGASLIFTTVKPSDTENYLKITKHCKRSARLFQLGSDCFNPLAHHQRRSRGSPDLVERLTQMVLMPLERLRQKQSGGDPFWYSSAALYVRTLLTIFLLADVTLSYKLIYDTLLTLPRDEEEIEEAEWQESCPAFRALLIATARTDLTDWQRNDLDSAAQFLLKVYPRTPDKTRQSTISTVTSALDPYVRGVIGHTINGDSDSWSPEEIVESPGVVILDMPLQTAGPAAATVQRMLIDALQQEVLRREKPTHPVVFICDEFQEFLSPDADASFLRTARDRLGLMVMATQCIGNIQMACGQANNPKAAADTLIALPTCRIFCNNSDFETNRYASDSFAKTLQVKLTSGNQEQQSDQRGKQGGRSTNISREYSPDVQEIEFLRLKTGSRRHHNIVEAYCSVSGRFWSNGRPSLLVTFNQIFL